MDDSSTQPLSTANGFISEYYLQFEPAEVRERDTIDWFVQLPPSDKTKAAGMLSSDWPSLPGFRRYFLERKGLFLVDYLRERLTAEEFAEWVDGHDKVGGLPVDKLEL